MAVDTAARTLTVVVCAIGGLIVGSFLNVVIYRVPRRRSVVHPGSACPQCSTALSGWENIPVISWIALRGRCGHCQAPISIRYPLVELMTACSFVALGVCVGPSAALVPILIVVTAATVAAAIELDGFEVPRSIAATALIGAAGLIAVSVGDHERGRLTWAAIAGLTAALVAAGGTALIAHHAPTGRREAPVVALAWSAGWLWPPGGLALAACAVICALSERSTDSVPRSVASRWDLAAFVSAAFVIVLVGALEHGPHPL